MTSHRWFHPHITGLEAEQLLLEQGTDGSFLCRPSGSDKKNFTISVRRGDSVRHIKVQNNGGCYDLFGGESFATLSELIQHYMENELREKDQELIELKYPMSCKDPTSERWFHGHMTGKEAEQLMLDKGKNGSYLVRESVSNPGNFALTVRQDDAVMHVTIRYVDDLYDVGGGPTFASISDLVEYYKHNPMVEKLGGNVVQLKQPLNATKLTASAVKERVQELSKENVMVPGKEGFWEEFESLQQQECKHLYSRKEGLKPENKNKNRYKNIVPFDHTRVVLMDGDPDDPSQDYINASYVDGENEREYIATQGPLAGTVLDFWRMVFQENARNILMVTKELEKGKPKCAKYWPDVNTATKVGKFHIANNHETVTQELILRELKLTNADEPEEETRTIFHYQYIGWPEHGIPEEPGRILGILYDINLKQKDLDYPGPIIVHCSPGIGRTGTVIVIDILVKVLQKQGLHCEIDVQKTVQLVRSQRQGMVQLEVQYKFIYLALALFVEMEQRILKHATMSGREAVKEARSRATAPAKVTAPSVPPVALRSPAISPLDGVSPPPPLPNRKGKPLPEPAPESRVTGSQGSVPVPGDPPPIPNRKR